MRKYRILFSIPVHEKPEVVLDQINNFLHFNPDCCIVLHISSGFRFDSDHISEDGFFSALGDIDRVYVNPNRLRSGLEDIIQCHISNFRYAYENIDFEYIVFASSNELFFRQGLLDDISRYDCGPGSRKTVKNDTNWIQGKHIFRDKVFIGILKEWGISQIYSGQFEGSFMKKDMMHNISDKIESFYDYRSMEVKYAREEVFFHTFIAAFYPGAHIRRDNTTYMDWNNDLRVYVADVINRLHVNDEKYSIKRVPRYINDEVRTFIREYVGCYAEENEKYFHNDGLISGDNTLVDECRKNEQKSNIFKTWLLNDRSGIGIPDLLVRNGWRTVSIYGFGEIGKILYDELKKSGTVRIEYVIDKRNTDETGKVRIVEPYPELSETDIIVVTALGDKELMDQLKDRYSIPCMTIGELLDKVSAQ